jgi:hypothetical protein
MIRPAQNPETAALFTEVLISFDDCSDLLSSQRMSGIKDKAPKANLTALKVKGPVCNIPSRCATKANPQMQEVIRSNKLEPLYKEFRPDGLSLNRQHTKYTLSTYNKGRYLYLHAEGISWLRPNFNAQATGFLLLL